MTKMLVVCEGDQTTRFDRDYYANRHLTLAMECWGPYGLEEARAFYPANDGDDWLSIGVYRFATEDAMQKALAAPETARVMEDVKNFTDSTVVVRSVFTPL